MGRVVAIDFGLKRCGIAVTDPSRIIASPLETVQTEKLRAFIKRYTETEPVDIIVFGLPVDLMNRDTHATENVRRETAEFQKLFPAIDIQTIDERFTSTIAQQALVTGGMKKKQRREKGNVDKVSATLILQSFLEQNS